MNIDSVVVTRTLQRGDITVNGEFLFGSNYTYLVDVAWNDNSLQAVYKPIKGEMPLWDFPPESLAHREVAAYLVSKMIGWNFVPPTVFREDAPFGAGSLQMYIKYEPAYHYFNFSKVDREKLPKVVLFDLIINNADRKGSHIIFDEKHKMWLIDHGVCFHIEDKLRTVIWDFSGEDIASMLLEDIRVFIDKIETGGKIIEQLAQQIGINEINAIFSRCERLLEEKIFIHPPTHKRAFPYPLL